MLVTWMGGGGGQERDRDTVSEFRWLDLENNPSSLNLPSYFFFLSGWLIGWMG
jgi:hypothetical protein